MSGIVPLVAVDPRILSSYARAGGTSGPRDGLTPLAKLGKAGIATPAAAAALLALHEAVTARGGDFRVTELHRDVGVQQAARTKYDTWAKAGKPKPGTAGFDAKTMKAAFVALPGRSMHNGGRAIDVNLGALKFPGVPADKQLDVLWELARPLGWAPSIKSADEGASEAWHFDVWGDLAGVLKRLGYEEAAKVGAILVGHSGDCQSYGHILQACLQRAGADIGKVDGAPGPKTYGAVVNLLGVPLSTAQQVVRAQDTSVFARLLALPWG